MSRRTVLAFAVLAMWLSASWVSAQGRAVPRGGGGGRGGQGAQVRHPAPRTGGGGYGHYGRGYGYGYGHGRGYYGHGHGYYRGYYPYYGYRPYYYGYPYYYGGYGYPYYGYYSPYYYGYGSSWGVGLGFGSPYLSVGLSYHSGDSGYVDPGYRGDAYGRDYGAERDPGTAPPATDTGVLLLEVFPADASVYVDDEFRGGGQRRHSLRLARGQHRIAVVHPRYPVLTRELTVEPGDRVSVRVELDRN